MRPPIRSVSSYLPHIGLLVAIVCLGIEPWAIARQVPSGRGLDRPGIGPGQGPTVPFLEIDWRYWWWMNEAWLTQFRDRLNIDPLHGRIAPSDRTAVIDALEKATEGSDPELRAAAFLALARTGDARAEPILRDGLGDAALNARRAALLGLGVLRRPGALATLEAIIDDEKWEGRERAIAALALGLIVLPEESDLSAAAIDGSGSRVAIAQRDGTLRVHDATDGSEIYRSIGAPAQHLLWADDLLLITSAIPTKGDDPGVLRRIEFDRKVSVSTQTIGPSTIDAIALSRDQKRIVTVDGDRVVRVHDLRSKRVLAERDRPFGPGQVTAVAFANDDESILIATNVPALQELDPTLEGERLITPLPCTMQTIRPLGDAGTVLVGGVDGTPRVYSSTGEAVQEFSSLGSPIVACAVGATATRIGFSAEDGGVRIYDAASGDEVTSFVSPAGPILDVTFDDDGVTHLAGGDGTLRQLDARVGTAIDRLAPFDHPTVAIAFQPDGNLFALAGGEGEIALFDRVTREERRRCEDRTIPIVAIEFDGRGDRLAVAGRDGKAMIVQTGRDQLLQEFTAHSGGVRCVSWSLDGRRLLTGGNDGTVAIWIANQGTEAGRIEVGRPITAARFSPRDSEIAAIATERELSLWDTKERIRVATLAGHEGEVTAVDWSPDGATLVSVGVDQSVRVWDVDSGRPIAEGIVHDGPIRDVSFLGVGSELATIGDDETARVFRTADLVEIARITRLANVIDIDSTEDGFGVITADSAKLFDSRNGIESVRLEGRSAAAIFERLLEKKTFQRFDDRVRSGIALGVGLTRNPDLAELVAERVGRSQKDSSITRSYLALSLGRLGNLDQSKELLKLLKDKDTQVRRSAALTIGALYHGSGDATILSALANQERSESETLTKAYLGIALARVGGSKATSTLYAKIAEGRTGRLPNVIGPPKISLGSLGREQLASLALGIIRHSNVTPLLLERFAQTADVSVKGAIALALGLIGDQRTGNAIYKELRETNDPRLVGHLSLALGLLGHSPAQGEIARHLEETNDAESIPWLAIALAMIQRPQAIVVVTERLAQQPNPAIAQALYYALGEIGDASSVAAILSTLNDRSTPEIVKRYAAVALGSLADGRVVPAMTQIRSDMNYTAETELMMAGNLLTFP